MILRHKHVNNVFYKNYKIQNYIVLFKVDLEISLKLNKVLSIIFFILLFLIHIHFWQIYAHQLKITTSNVWKRVAYFPRNFKYFIDNCIAIYNDSQLFKSNNFHISKSFHRYKPLLDLHAVRVSNWNGKGRAPNETNLSYTFALRYCPSKDPETFDFEPATA